MPDGEQGLQGHSKEALFECYLKPRRANDTHTVDIHYVGLQMQSIQMCNEKYDYNDYMILTYDDMEWCSVMISVPKIHVMKLRVMIFKLSIEIDNWRIKKDDFDFNFDFDCAFELSIETDKRRDWWR